MRRFVAATKKFYAYQKERFPIVILGLSLLPAALSSAVIVSTHSTAMQITSAVIASLAYLLHIRIIDEHRDFEHDNMHHAVRPIQTGIISKEELRYVDIIAIAVLLFIALTAGYTALIIAGLMLGYAYFAGKEFFVGEKIRNHFFVYNGVNLVQMLLMQLFVYSIFAGFLPFNQLVILHFLFTTTGTVIFELVRKLKIPGEDGTGRDTYTYYIGFNTAMIIYLLLIIFNASIFFTIVSQLAEPMSLVPSISLFVTLLAFISVSVHWIKKAKLTDQLMQLSFLSLYGLFNLVIYFVAQY
jgi:hypothetical protein